MKKKIILILTILTAIFFISACAAKKNENSVPVSVEPTEAQSSSDEPAQTSESAQNNGVLESSEGYHIAEQTIERELIKVKYPQISGLENKTLEEQYDSILKTYIIDNLENYTEKDTYELSYEIATQTQDLISIVFRGYSNFDMSAHPSFVVYTLNINLLEGKITRLKDQMDVEALAQQILDKKGYDFYDIEGDEFDENGREELEVYLLQDTEESLSETLRNFDIDPSPDTYPSGYSYYKEGNLHLFMSVPHVFGDFIELRFH